MTERKVDIIEDLDGNKIVVIHDIFFMGRRKINWYDVEEYLKRYVGEVYQISESGDKIYIGRNLPDEYAHSSYTKSLKGRNAKYGWYRYDIRFALPVYDDILIHYNVFTARLLVNHAENGKKYLYDVVAIKKETSKPQQDVR